MTDHDWKGRAKYLLGLPVPNLSVREEEWRKDLELAALEAQA
mgnify:CR=1 FL=1